MNALINRSATSYTVQTSIIGCTQMSDYRQFSRRQIEDRAVELAEYIIKNNATVRQTAKQFGVSKSTVHMEVTI